MSSNNIGSIYATTVSSEKYIIIDSQNIELRGNVIMKEHVTISGNLEPFAISNTSKLGSATKLWSNAYITNISTSNISISEMITLPANSINSNHIQNETILEGDIANLNITESKIADSAVTVNKIGDSAVTVNKIGPLAVTGDKIAEGTIGYSKFTTEAITTLQITPTNSINSDHIQTGTITGSNIAQRTIGADKIDNSGTWTFTNISGTHMSLSGDLEPLIPNSTSKLGSTAKYWSNAYITNISASNISVSGNIILNISGSNIRNINQLSADVSNNKITTTHRIYQEISGDISWSAVNGYYGLAKDAYPALNPLSSGAKAVSSWTRQTTYANDSGFWNSICWSPKLGIFVAVASLGDKRVMTSKNGIVWSALELDNINIKLTSVCWSPQLEIFVAVFRINTSDTSANKVVTSSNGTTWIERENGVLNNNWSSVCWSAELSLFVAVAQSGAYNRVMYSSDGTSWNSDISGVDNNNWISVCWSAELGIFVAIAYDGTNRVMTSNNGKNWTSLSIGTSIGPYSICWSAQLGIFVAVGFGDGFSPNRVMISSNGKNWILTPALTSFWSNVCWSPQLGIFVAVSYQNSAAIHMMYSYDGLNWIIIPNIASLNWTSICWSSELGIFAVVGLASTGNTTKKVLTSSFQGRPPTSYNVFDSSFNAIDESGNWSFSNISASNISVSGNIILNISGSNIRNINQLSADVSNNKITTTHRIYQEISGDISWSAVNGYYGLAKDAYPALNPLSSGEKAVSSWTERTTGVETSEWCYICWSAQRRLFVAVASSGVNKVMISSNGINWTPIVVTDGAIPSQWMSVCWSQEISLFVAVAKFGIHRVMTSEDGITWIPRTIEVEVSKSAWHDICWSAELGIFVAVANIGNYKVMTSSDGIVWAGETTENTALYGVCWSAELGLFVAVGKNVANNVMISSNGKMWRPITITQELQNYEWLKVCWSAQLGLFAAVANNAPNNVMISNDGINWTPKTVETVTESAWTNICWSAELSLFIAVAESGTHRLMTSNNGLIWTKRTTHVVINGEWNGICWSPELGIAVAVAKVTIDGLYRVMTSSLQGRPPTSYNVFDSSFNAIDESGNWTFQNIDITSNLYPSLSIETTKLEASGNYSNFEFNSTYSYYIYRNEGNGYFIPGQSDIFDVLIVGGGGGGGSSIGGGGGGGGVIYLPSVKLSSGTTYSVSVGSGGASNTNGNPSSFNGAVAAGGGAGGGPWGSAKSNGYAGGCGGGACSNIYSTDPLYTGGESIGNRLGPNLGTIYGSRGGSLTVSHITPSLGIGNWVRSAGGGGAGGAALNTNPNTLMTSIFGEGSGGIGTANTMYLGYLYFWGGGGGGGTQMEQNGGFGGWGGGGGGGGCGRWGAVIGQGGGNALNDGGNSSISTSADVGGAGGDGGANTGGGGGGGCWYNGPGGKGGSGIVIIRCSRTAYSTNTNIGLTTKPWNNAVINNLTVNKLTIGDTNSVDVINNLLNRVSILENKISNSVYKIEYFKWTAHSVSYANNDTSSFAFTPNNAISQFTKEGNTKIRIKSSFSYNMDGWGYDYIRSRLSIYLGNTYVVSFLGSNLVETGTDMYQDWQTADYGGAGTRSGVLSEVSVFMDTLEHIAMSGTFTIKLEIDKSGSDDTVYIYAGHHEVTHLYA